MLVSHGARLRLGSAAGFCHDLHSQTWLGRTTSWKNIVAAAKKEGRAALV